MKGEGFELIGSEGYLADGPINSNYSTPILQPLYRVELTKSRKAPGATKQVLAVILDGVDYPKISKKFLGYVVSKPYNLHLMDSIIFSLRQAPVRSQIERRNIQKEIEVYLERKAIRESLLDEKRDQKSKKVIPNTFKVPFRLFPRQRRYMQ